MSQAGGQGGRTPPQFLVDQLTLSRPGGAHYPHPLLPAPPDFLTLGHAWVLRMWCPDYFYSLYLTNFVHTTSI